MSRAIVDRDLLTEVEQFLYREALALDERRFQDWLAYFSDDVTYEVPVRLTREGNADWELSPTSRIFDDTKETLAVRVQRLETDFAWSEQPPSRTRHFVTNVLVDETDVTGEYLARSNCFVYRSRGDDPNPNLYSLARQDTLRRVGDSFHICRRWAAFDQAMINALNLSIFF